MKTQDITINTPTNFSFDKKNYDLYELYAKLSMFFDDLDFREMNIDELTPEILSSIAQTKSLPKSSLINI